MREEKLEHCTRSRGSKAFAVGVLGCVLLVAGQLTPAKAGTVDGCMVERFNETKPANKTSLNCTSNDVRLAIYRLAGAPTACIDGQDVTEALIGEFVATSAERWDVGAFISVDGGTPNALGGSCYSDFLHPVSVDNTDLDLMGGFGPYYNGEITEDPGDMCGDIQQGMNAFLQTDVITFPCQDSDGDGKADIQSCTVWANSRSDGGNKPSCIDEGNVTAETTAKCTCSTVNIADLDFLEDATIIVNKVVLYADGTPGAPGLFDLEVDGTAEATDQGNGGTTGDVIVAAGTTSNPGAPHTVGESAGTGTSLADYDSSISCDNGQGCTACTSFGFVINPTDVVTCTITNQLKDPCLNVDCSFLNDPCNDGVCDPDLPGSGIELCVAVPKANSTPCEDGLYCTSFGGVPGDPDHCFDGTCTGEPVDCGEGDDCNTNECNEDSDACEFVPVMNSTPCEDGLYCTSFGGVPGDPDHCFDGTCTGEPVDCGEGDDCNTNECNEDSDACEFVPVMNSTPCEDGLYCTSFGGVPGDPDHCFDGTCTGEPVDCGEGDDCNTNECNEDSDACEFVPVMNSTPCEDGFFCTSFGGVPGDPDHCFDGTCTGEPVDCGEGDDCNTNECNEDSDACEFVPVMNSTPCEDGLYCTSFGGVPGDADHCFDGTCTGTPVDCGDGDDCNTNECNEDSDACEFVPVMNSTPCEDGLYCTSFGGVPGDPDHCFDGTCTGEPVDCGEGDDCNTNECNEDSDACEFVPVMNSTPCEDGLYCTSFGGVPGDPDHCFDGTCTGEPVDCGEGDDCNTNECNEDSDACEFVPVMNSTPCEDGLYCTSFGGVPGDPDHCFDGTCTGEPVDCGEGDDCNTNECNEDSDACEFVPVMNSTPCEDGLYCTSFGGVPGDPDHCFDGTCTGEPVDCGEGDDCNTNECNEDSDACEFVPVMNSTPCEDGLYCTSFGGVPGDPDHCFDGTCTGEPVDCGEGDDCNTNECNEDSDACEFVPVMNSTPCEDGLYCTSFGGVPGDPDHCFDGTCTGEPVDCGEGDDCNTNECNEDSDACEFVPVMNSTPCEDGLYCTSFGGVPGDPDHCFDGTCTGEPVDCGEGDDCNTNECNEDSDACEFVPVANSTPCEDGFFCTSFGGVPGDPDHCFDGTCTGDPVDCDDGFVCTEDSCDEENDQCVNDWICDQPSILITNLGLVFDSTTMLSGDWGISNESGEPGVEAVVSEFDMLVEVRFRNPGRWTPVDATCTFNPDAPVAVPEDDFNNSTAELVGTYTCTLDSAVLESGNGVRVTLNVTILDRTKAFSFKTTGTF